MHDAHKHDALLWEVASVPTSVHTSILLRKLGQCPLEHLWWRRTDGISCWHSLAALPDSDLVRQVAVDA